MRKIHFFATLAAIMITQPVFANISLLSDTRPCGVIAKACLSAGYARHSTDDTKYWANCMKPIILGHAVKGVIVDAATVKSCREDKIAALKKELNELESVSTN